MRPIVSLLVYVIVVFLGGALLAPWLYWLAQWAAGHWPALSGLAAGLLLVPLTTALLWGGLAWLGLFAIPWPYLHDLCAQGFSLLYTVIERCAEFFGRLPGLSVRPDQLPWIVAGSAVVLVCLCTLLPVRARTTARAS